MNVLAVNFSPSAFDRQHLLDFLNTLFEIKNWLAVNESLVLVVTDLMPIQLQQIINTAFPELSFMIFFVHPHEVDGRETLNVWDFINNPKSSGRWSDATWSNENWSGAPRGLAGFPLKKS